LSGKDHPSIGNPDFDSLSWMQIDTNTAEFTSKEMASRRRNYALLQKILP